MTSRAERDTRSARLLGILVLLVILWPTSASAHGINGLAESDYLVEITSTPDLPGVTVRTIETGARIELINEAPYSVEVLGYSGEPYAEIRPDGVYLNRMSPAPYLNETDGGGPPPSFASAAATPQWLKASDEPRLRWHDHRAGWMGRQPPPHVQDDPQLRHRVLDWTVPLRVGTNVHFVHGHVDWIPPPDTAVWTAGVLMLAACVTASALSTVGRRWVAPVLIALAGGAAVADAVGRATTAADYDVPWFLVLITAEAWPALAGLASLAAAGYALTRKPGADLAWGVAGAATALMAGVSRFGGFTSSITPTPWDGDVTRLLVLIALGVGAGLAAATLVSARRPRDTASE